MAAQPRARVNQLQGIYDHGRSLPSYLREIVLDLNHEGVSQREIARQLRTSRHFVQNVLQDYNIANSFVQPLRKDRQRTVLSPEIMDCLEVEKLMKPSIYAAELQNRLVLDGIVHPVDLPHATTITKFFRNELLMTWKKIQSVPSESRCEGVEEYTDFYLDQVSDLHYTTLHFFDESSVVKTTMNRRYGNAPIGQPAIEIQRYASNATFTINLLHSCLGVDHVEVIEGASNGNEMLLFFERAVDITRPDGSVLLERGDTVVMDNCPFHHARFTELALRGLLGEYGIGLLFQPPYSPHLNTCELCFHQIKAFLKNNQQLAEHETEIAILEACQHITAQNSMAYFKHCGYVI